MYRERLLELKKKKGITTKEWSDMSGVSVDTIKRITSTEHVEKESARVNTLNDLCQALGIELWEIFYNGDVNLCMLLGEIDRVKIERDNAIAENALLKEKVDTLRDKLDELKDDIIFVHNHYLKKGN
jgi:transcriptional regulator with XRE-family HTH domain